MTTAPDTAPPTVARRVLTLLPWKLLVGAALTVIFCAAYYGNQYVSLRPVFPMPATWLDRIVPFRPGTTWLYVSWYLMLPVAPLLIGTRDQLWRYALGLFVMGIVGNGLFLLFPTGVARPPAPVPAEWLYGLVTSLDRPVNACPSLHASLTVFTCVWFARLCYTDPRLPLRRPAIWVALMWVWAAGIFYATIATRQHVLVDLVAGTVLALVCYLPTVAQSGPLSLRERVKLRGRESKNGSDTSNAPSAPPSPGGRASESAGVPECLLEHQRTRRLVSAGVEAEVAELRRLSATKRFAELAFFPLLWLAGGSLALYALRLHGPPRYVAYAAGFTISAVALNAFVLLLHEGMHATLFAGRRANRWVSVALGGCVLISFTAYQVLHLRHHTYLGDERDPDDYNNYSRSPRVVWMLHYVRLAAGAFLYVLLIPFLARRYGTAMERRRVFEEYCVLACAWSLAFALVPTPVLVHTWLLPLVLVGYMTNIRGFTQHGLTDAHDPLLASRSMHPNPVVSFLLLNENLHLEHHLFPEIPSYSLGRLRKLIEPNLPRAIEGRSYLAFLGTFFRATFRAGERAVTVGVKVRS